MSEGSTNRSRPSSEAVHEEAREAGAGQRALLIDGHSLAFRAFFALPELTTAQGQATGALHGFLNMLRRLVAEEKPDYLAVAFDRGRPQFRLDLAPQYKAQREQAPEAFRSQVSLLRAILPGLGCPVVERDGLEGDDILGTLATTLSQAGIDVRLVSGDRDLLQLVSDHVLAIVPKRGITEVVRWDAHAVQAEYGVTPEHLPDFKALAGDPSDNLPGVPGIGTKTAHALLVAGGSLDTLLDDPPESLTPRQRALLKEHADSARRQRAVATILREADLGVTAEQMRFVPRVTEEARAALEDLELRGALGRWAESLGGSDSGRGTAERVVKTDPGSAEASSVQVVVPAPVPASDTRTLGVAARVEGGGGRRVLRELAVWSNEGLWHLTASDGDSLTLADFPREVLTALTDPARPKVGYDLKPLVGFFLEQEVSLAGPLWDLGVAAYLLDSGRSTYPPDFLLGRLGLAGVEWPEEAGERATLTAALAEPLREALQTAEALAVFERAEVPLIPVLALMEEVGIQVDPDVLTELGREFATRIASLESEIHALAGGPFNVNSSRQLAEVLFERLGLPVSRRTKTGPSTDADVLAELTDRHPIAAAVLSHRQLVKLRSTYVEGLRPLIQEDGRIRTTFHQTVAATGRLSSADPNLQNIPVRLEEGRRIRSAFVAAPGHRFVSADYSQIELRLLAHLSGDSALREAFLTERDIHTETAAVVFGVDADAVTPDMRRRAKAVNFGIVYGISDYGLSKDLAITVSEAHAFIEAYMARYPRVQGFLHETVEAARERGYTQTPLGRRRYLPELQDRRRPSRMFAERQAMNAPIQGMAADIIKEAMVRAHHAHLPGAMLLQVHDELMFEVPEAQVELLARGLRAVLEAAPGLSVPLTAEVKTGRSWNDAKVYPLSREGSTAPAVGGPHA